MAGTGGDRPRHRADADRHRPPDAPPPPPDARRIGPIDIQPMSACKWRFLALPVLTYRSEEHTSELQSLMRISYAVFCLKKKNNNKTHDRCTPLPSQNLR